MISSTELIRQWEEKELPILKEKDFKGNAERMAYVSFLDGFSFGVQVCKLTWEEWHKLKVTYVRSGVMFFEFYDEPNVEHAWFISSFNSHRMAAAQIYPYEIERILSKEYPNNNFVEICKQCKWETYNGKIQVEVIWSHKDM